MQLMEMRTDGFVAFLVVHYLKCTVQKNKVYSWPLLAWILLPLNLKRTEKELPVISVNMCKMSLGIHVDVILHLNLQNEASDTLLY